MSILSKLKGLSGLAKYEYYVEVLRRCPVYHLYKPVPFQYADWLWMDATAEGCMVRACGGSKTFDAVQWVVLRATLMPHERWAWLAAASGQLDQARFYFKDHPFVRNISGGLGKEIINLYSGARILLRGTTVAITGLRLDGIILDEEEMLQPRQVQLVYPQLHGRMSFSSVGKFFHLGTMQYDAPLFMDNIEKYPIQVHDWTECPWLVKAGHIQRLIDEGKTPEWQLDMLYWCIATAPHGMLFPHVRDGRVPIGEDGHRYNTDDVKDGIDFGSQDTCVGIIVRGTVCYVVEEYEFALELHPEAYDFLKGRSVEVEGGGYNDQEKHGEKSKLMIQRIAAFKRACSNKWKAERQKIARGFTEIVIDREACPKTWADIKGSTFGPDGLYFKHPTQRPCHNLDAFFHCLHQSSYRLTYHETRTNLNSFNDPNYLGSEMFGEV